jgi:hypothetical protein
LNLGLTSAIATPMRCILISLVSAAVVAALAPPTVSHALTPAQSAAVTMKAKADAGAKTKAQALSKARTEALVQKAKGDTVAKTRATWQLKQGVRLEVKRRTEAADKAAKLHRQIVRTAWAVQAADHPHQSQPHMRHADRHGHHTVGRERHREKAQQHATRHAARR